MRTIRYDEAVKCTDKYERCPELSCPFNMRHVPRKASFSLFEWRYDVCPKVSGFINDSKLDKSLRMWVKRTLFDGEDIPIPREMGEFFKRKREKESGVNGPSLTFNDRG